MHWLSSVMPIIILTPITNIVTVVTVILLFLVFPICSDVAEPEKIIWNAYTGSKKEMKYSTFKKNLSNIRTERKNQKK